MGVPGSEGLGPLEIIRARRGIDVGVGLNVIGGDGIDVNGGTVAGGGAALISFRTDNKNIRFNGDLDLQSSARFDTGNGLGDVIFTSGTPIDSSDGPESTSTGERNNLTVNAGVGQVVFNANLGESQRLGELTIERGSGGVVFGGADGAATGGAGPVTTIATDGAINLGAGNSTDNVIDAGIIFNGGAAPVVVTTSDDLVRLNGPVTASSKLMINTSGGNLLLTDASPLNSQPNEFNDVTIDVGTGDGTFDASIGVAARLGELQIINAHDVTFASTVFASRISQLAGSGTTTFNGALDTTDVGRSGIELTGTDVTLNAPITATGDGRVIINQSGRLDINDNANMRLDGAFRQTGGTVETAADIVTSGDAIEFGGTVLLTDGLAANVRLDTTADGNVTGARVSFFASLDGQTDSSETLYINAGIAHDVLFSEVVGTGAFGGAGGARVKTIGVIQARDVIFGDRVVVGNLWQTAGQGTTTFSGSVDANSPVEKALDLATVNIMFSHSVTTQGDGRIELTTTGLLDIGMLANMNLNGAFRQDGGGMTRLSADIVNSNDDVRFSDAVILGDDVSINTGVGNGGIAFLDLLDGQVDCGQNLTLVGGGEMRFAGAVGSLTALGDMLIDSGNDITFQNSLRVNSFTQPGGDHTLFSESVVIKSVAGFDATGLSFRFDGDVDTTLANGPIRVTAVDEISVNARLDSGAGAVTLLSADNVSMTANGAILTTDAEVFITANQVNMADGARLRTGSGVIVISAAGDVRLGSLHTTRLAQVVSTAGRIIDGGDVDGFDITADRVALQARHGIGTDDPIDVRVNEIAARNLEEGGIRFDNRITGKLTIGTVDGLSGIMAGPVTPADLGGDIEISHVGTIDVDTSIQNNAGGHTIVRAENPGTLNINQPIQNRGGDGWILLYAGEDLIINDSLPEFINNDRTQSFPEAEISVQNEGAIRGQARGRVIVDNSDTDYVIIRTHAERFPDADNLPTLPAKFFDPADFPEDDLAFYAELDAALTAQRDAVSAQITNVAPIFDIESVDQGGSNLDEKSRGILKITIGDDVHLERNFHVTVDWGDGIIENYTIPGNQKASRGFILANDDRSNIPPDATITARFDSGELLSDGTAGPGVYFIHHTYIQPPDLSDPAAPIPVMAEIRYDARSEGETDLDIFQPADGSAIFNGIRFFENLTQEITSVDFDIMTNPGQGAFAFIKVIESEIIPVQLRKVATVMVGATTVTVTTAFGEQFDFIATRFETQLTDDYRLFFVVVDINGKEMKKEFDLPNERISDLLPVFTKEFPFPSGHYRVYLEDLRTRRKRMILDVHIHEGRVVPQNFRDGATERQPGSDAVEKASTDARPSPDEGAARSVHRGATEAVVASPRAAETSSSVGVTADDTVSASIGGAAAWLALNHRLRRRLKKPESSTRRLDKAARIARRLRDKFTL
jgi:hypothetical protein